MPIDRTDLRVQLGEFYDLILQQRTHAAREWADDHLYAVLQVDAEYLRPRRMPTLAKVVDALRYYFDQELNGGPSLAELPDMLGSLAHDVYRAMQLIRQPKLRELIDPRGPFFTQVGKIVKNCDVALCSLKEPSRTAEEIHDRLLPYVDAVGPGAIRRVIDILKSEGLCTDDRRLTELGREVHDAIRREMPSFLCLCQNFTHCEQPPED